jgi:hypothetical protein
VAWLFDFYFLSFFGGAVVALFLAIQGRPGSLRLALSLAAAFLIVSLVYHLVAAKRVAIVSPGETVAGRVLLDGRKQWVTYYERSRWPLFALAALAVVGSGNVWDGIGEGRIYTVQHVLFQSLVLFGLAASVLAAAKGRPAGLLGVAAYYLFLALATWFGMQSLVHEVRLVLFFGCFSLAICSFAASRRFATSVNPHVRPAV